MNYFLVPSGADYNIADHYGTLNLGDFTLDSSISSVPQSMPTSPHTTDSSFEANWQEHQGYNNTWYHNDSNQGHAQNDVQFAFGNQGYSATQYGGIQENLQEHQGYNIGYQNYSNQGHAPNAENQGYSTTEYSVNQQNWQEHQGYNIGYQNDSNQGHAPNNVQFVENHGYQTTQGSNNGSAQNDVQPAASQGYKGNYILDITF